MDNCHLTLQLASPEDEPWIRPLLIQCDLPHEDLTPEHLRHFWVCREKGILIGSVGLEIFGPSALLRSLAIHPRFRKRGFASQLVQRAEDYAATLQVRKLFLLTMTAESFFRNRGYQKIDRSCAPPQIRSTKEFQSLCPASSVCLTKKLSR